MVNEDGSYLQEDTTTMDDCDNQMTDEEVLWNRGTNMGHGLQRINRARRGKLPIIIPEGQIRPLTPVIAAKYATECNIAVRSHVPILIRWKDYKKRPATIVKTSPVTTTSDAEWIKLVESWKTPKKMEACQKNKDNRALVKFPATTGSCSYPVFVENLGGEFEEKEPDAFDLFKLCHFSKKKQGYTPNVQLAIDQMETLLAASPQEGGDPKSTTEVVGDVLDDNTRKNMFLQNVGIQTTRPRSNAQKVQAELEVEKMANVELRGKVDDLKRKVEETEQERLRDKEEMMKKQAELEAKLEKLSQHRPAD